MKYLRCVTKLTITLFFITGCQQLGTGLFRDNLPAVNPSENNMDRQPAQTEPHSESGPDQKAGGQIAITTTSPNTPTDGSLAVETDSALFVSAVVQKTATNEDVLKTSSATGRDLWDRIRAGFKLDQTTEKKRIDSEARWFVDHPDYLDRVANRARRYLYHIQSEVDNRALPTELVLLPIVESAYDPFAYSHGRAMGLWQFIPSTAKLFRLKKNWWYDGRRDTQAATTAALDYLDALHAEFDGDWLLALAAYNSGAGTVRSAIAKNRRLGKPVDFWSLKLPLETRTYVPRLLAISRLVADPAGYGIEFPTITDQPYWVQVETGSQIDLTLAAQLAEISVEELYLLNPGFSRWATHPQGPHRLLVPVDQQQIFIRNLAGLSQDERVAWRRHRIVPGENLGLIASKYNTTVNTIKLVNGLSSNIIPAGGSLLIPSALQDQDSYTLSRGERLKSTQTHLQDKKGRAPMKYKVVNGDNLWDISRKYNVNLRALAKWNGLAPTDLLHPGTELSIWSAKPGNELVLASIDDNQRAEVIRKINYRVRKGESLSRIASKFNLSVKKIEKWNRQLIGKQYIQPGQRLILYVDVIQAE